MAKNHNYGLIMLAIGAVYLFSKSASGQVPTSGVGPVQGPQLNTACTDPLGNVYFIPTGPCPVWPGGATGTWAD